MPREPHVLHVVTSLPAEPEARPIELELDVLYRRYASYVAAIAYRLLGREDDVDDIVQEVFLVAVRGLGSLREAHAVKGWLARITVRMSRRRLRTRRVKVFLGLDEPEAYVNVADRSAGPELRAVLSRVYLTLDTLPTNERLAWTLRYVEGEQLESIAALLGCSLPTAKRRIRAAAQKIEEAFSDG